MFKSDFPIFENNPWLVYLDTTATAQKPKLVIEALCNFYKKDYANIHRGSYALSEKSEEAYDNSKKKVKEFINASSIQEIIYTYNANYALNILASSLECSGYLKKGDKVLLTITEHHANIVPWLNLKEKAWIEVEFIAIKDDFSLDMDDFTQKYDDKVKVISFTQVSNVTGEIYDLEKVGQLIRDRSSDRPVSEKPIFIVDASQSIPHMQVDVKKLNSDFLFFTAHKLMAETWLGVLWWKKEILSNMKSAFSGGWAINWVKEDSYRQAALPSRFEPGTPHISGALTLLKSLEYIESIWWYESIETYDRELIKYTLKKLEDFPELHLVWWTNLDSRIWVFSFYLDNFHSLDIAEKLAEKNICVRAGQHCAEPLALRLGISSTFRMSLYIYNTFEDIDRFFDELKKIIQNLD